MANLEATFEVLENRLMRAWMHRDPREVKATVSSDAIFMFGTSPPALLDRASFIASMQDGFRLHGFRFHELTARKYGRCVWFSGQAELEMTLGGVDWKGNFLLTDLWRKGIVRRSWALAERSIAPAEGDKRLSDAIRAMQLWH